MSTIRYNRGPGPGCNYVENTLKWCSCIILIQTIHGVGFTFVDIFTVE